MDKSEDKIEQGKKVVIKLDSQTTKKKEAPTLSPSSAKSISKYSRNPFNEGTPSIFNSRDPFDSSKIKRETEKRKANRKKRIYTGLGVLCTALVIFALVLIGTEFIDSIKKERKTLEELTEQKLRQSASNGLLGEDVFNSEIIIDNEEIDTQIEEFSFESDRKF